MSFMQFLRIIWARRIIVLIATFACFFAAVVAGRLIPARFTAHSRVLLDVVKPDPVTGQIITSTFARAYVKTQTELIGDYRVAGRVVDTLGWTNSPELATQYQQRPSSDHSDFRRWLAQRVIDRTDANLIEGTNILDITYSSPAAQQAATVADAVRKAYIEQVLAFKREDAERNASWFKRQAERIRGELTAAEARKADFERANGIVLNDDNSDTESERLKALASASAAAPSVMSAPAAAAAAESPALAQANANLANAEKVLGPNNPDLLNLRRQRDALAAAGSPRAAIARSVASGPSIASQYSAQQAKVLAQRGKVSEAQRLAADVTLLRDQYSKTAARAAELEQQGESTETGLTLLGSAVAPVSPSFPNWPLLIIGSLGLGGALGVFSTLITELLGRRVRSPEDLKMPDVPVIGVMAAPQRSRASRSWREWIGLGRSRRVLAESL